MVFIKVEENTKNFLSVVSIIIEWKRRQDWELRMSYHLGWGISVNCSAIFFLIHNIEISFSYTLSSMVVFCSLTQSLAPIINFFFCFHRIMFYAFFCLLFVLRQKSHHRKSWLVSALYPGCLGCMLLKLQKWAMHYLNSKTQKKMISFVNP